MSNIFKFSMLAISQSRSLIWSLVANDQFPPSLGSI